MYSNEGYSNMGEPKPDIYDGLNLTYGSLTIWAKYDKRRNDGIKSYLVRCPECNCLLPIKSNEHSWIVDEESCLLTIRNPLQCKNCNCKLMITDSNMTKLNV